MKFIPKPSSFVKTVFLLSGSDLVLAALGVAILPLLSRLYSVGNFVEYSYYWAITGVLLTVVTGRYDLALIGSESEEDNVALLWGAVFVTIFLSCAFGVGLYGVLPLILRSQNFPLVFILACVLTLLFGGLFQIFYSFANCRENYAAIAKAQAASRLATILLQLFFGVVSISRSGLVWGAVIGNAVGFFVVSYIVLKEKKGGATSFSKIKAVLKRQRRYPLYLLPAGLLESLSSRVHLFLFGNFFGQELVGQLGFYQRIVQVPQTAAINSVGILFRQKANRLLLSGSSAKSLMLNTMASMGAVVFVPTLIISFFGGDLFTMAFSEKWRQSGEIAQTLIWVFFLNMVVSPISFLIYIGQRQKLDLYLQLLHLCLVVLGIYTGAMVFHSSQAALIGFALAFVIKYGLAYLFSYVVANSVSPKGDAMFGDI